MKKIRSWNVFVLVLILVLEIVIPSLGYVNFAYAKEENRESSAQIVSDYNTSIGTGTPYILGGGGKTPTKDQGNAWGALQEIGIRIIKVEIDLKMLFPINEENMDSNVMENYNHVAGSILSRANGAGMEVMLEFQNLPEWLDTNTDKKYDDVVKYQTMIEKAYTEIKNTWPNLIKFVEIVPDASLINNDFTEVYLKTAEKIRSIDPNVQIGGPGYELKSKSDSLSENVKNLLNAYVTWQDKSLLQYISFRGYGVNPTDGNSNMEIFGEFKEGRKAIRNASQNADLPLFMTGWSSIDKNAASANDTITNDQGINYHISALFKAMRDGWNLVLFDSMASNQENASSYAYTLSGGNPSLNPFTKSYQLLKKLGLAEGNFKVISTDMGTDWAVSDSLAMLNQNNEAIMLLLASEQKTNVTIEMRNVPYEDGAVQLETYVASSGISADSVYSTVNNVEVRNGIINAAIPIVPSGAMGIVIKGGTKKQLEAQTIYEFESQDNHFGGNTEIGWTNNASFNRTVSGFGGADNFVTLRKVAADGTGTYTAQLFAAQSNANVRVSVNNGAVENIDASLVSLIAPVTFDIRLQAGNQNTIKFYTTSGELKPDKLVLIPKDVSLSVGFQNLSELQKETQGNNTKYILPLKKTDFVLDARIFPANAATGKNLTYSSSDVNCAAIDPNTGAITPISEGETTITATIIGETDKNGQPIQDSFILKIKNAISKVTISPSTLSLSKEKEAQLTVSIEPEDAPNKTIIWSSSNENIVKIISSDNNRAIIKAIGENGAAVISAKAEDGGLSASCTVTISKLESGGNITADFGSTIAKGNPNIFGITHYPSINTEDADIGDHSIVWDMLKETGGVRFIRADARLQEILPIWTKRPNTNWEKPANGEFDPSKQPNYVKSDLYYVTGPDGVERAFTVDDYKADMEYYKTNGTYLNGMSNPENWNTKRLLNWVKKAKQEGFEVMVMTFQIPEWLAGGTVLPGAPHTEKLCNSAPKDWEIYRDIIKKVYKLMKKEGVDYYEFLNEPHWYVPKGGQQKDPNGILYSSMGLSDASFANAVAADQFYQAIDAIYEAERELTGKQDAKPTMKLGGGADDSWGGSYGVLGNILSDKYKEWIDRIDFISIHKYGERPANQDDSNNGANARNLKHWLKEKTGRNIPLFLNEYNISTGQPQDETYGNKSLGWHTKNLIDMMIDEFSGGGYYTCYPADVPMDDYEASSGWIERGKGMYTWNNGDPYLATFTKAWDLMSRKLGLGEGSFKVKSIDFKDSTITQAAAAVNKNGNPAIILNNYTAKKYGDISIRVENLPFKIGSTINAKIYSMDSTTDVNAEPIAKNITVEAGNSAVIEVDTIESYGVVGILLEGNIEVKPDKTYEIESYYNDLHGSAKINKEESASNGRWVIGTLGEENAAIISVQTTFSNATLFYQASQDAQLHYSVNGGEEKVIPLVSSSQIENIKLPINSEQQKNQIKLYTTQGNISLDKLLVVSINKDTLQELVNEFYEENLYTKESYTIYKTALEQAKQILKNISATEEEIKTVYNKLADAIAGLVKKANLDELINQKFDPNNYTTESWCNYAIALETAKLIKNNTQATDTDHVEAYRYLKEMIDNLASIPSDISKSIIEGKQPTSNVTITNSEAATDGNIENSSQDPSNTTILEAGTETGGSDNGYSNWEDVYLQYDFGSICDINKIVIYRQYYYDGGPIRWKDVKVELSTSPNFEKENSVTLFGPEDIAHTNENKEKEQIIESNIPINSRYIRIYGKGHQGSWGGYSNKVNICEVQVYGLSKPNNDYLHKTIEETKKLSQKDYSKEEWEKIQTALQEAQKIFDKSDATQGEINTAAANLKILVWMSTQKVLEIQVLSDKDTIKVNETIKMTAIVLPITALNRKVQWSVDNDSFASIDQDGVLKAKKKGLVMVTATAMDGSKITGKKQITIIETQDPIIPPTPDFFIPPHSSSDNNTVREDTIVTIEGEIENDKNNNVTIFIKEDKLKKAIEEAISLAEKENSKQVVLKILTSNLKQETKNIQIILPENAAKLIGNSRISDIVIETPKVIISFNKNAIQTITKEAQGTITIGIIKPEKLTKSVRERIGNRPVYDLSITSKNGTISNLKGGIATIKIPYILQNKETKDSIKVAFIDENGKIIIIEESEYDENTQYINSSITHFSLYAVVNNITDNIIKVAKDIISLYPGKTKQIKLVNLTDKDKVTYKSSNTKIAKVGKKTGKVKAIKKGNATITIKIDQQDKKITQKVLVKVKKPTLKINKKVKKLKVGNTYQFKAKKKGIKEKVIWFVNDKKAAKINKNTGKLKTKKAGTITITAKAGKIKTNCKVKIKD